MGTIPPRRKWCVRGRKSLLVATCRAEFVAAAADVFWAERFWCRPVRAPAKTNQARLEMSLTIVKNATCTFCGCVCDDIELHADGTRIVETKRACSLGESWFKNHTAEHLYPDALIDGKEATVDDAVEAAADYLLNANMPLVYGMSNITCEAQREAVSLAELIGGVIDSHTSL